MSPIICAMQPEDLTATAALVGRTFHDEPISIAASAQPEERAQALRIAYRNGLRYTQRCGQTWLIGDQPGASIGSVALFEMPMPADSTLAHDKRQRRRK